MVRIILARHTEGDLQNMNYAIKRIIPFFMAAATLCGVLSSCKRETGFENRISQIRSDILRCETESFSLTAYCERRETPFLEDGMVGNEENLLVFSLTDKREDGTIGQPSLKVTIDRETYTLRFPPELLSPTRKAELPVTRLPANSLSCDVTFGGKTEKVELRSVRKPSTAEPDRVVKALSDTGNEKTRALMNAETFEIRIRLIEHGGFLYYYAGVIAETESGEKEKAEILFDGETLEEIAVRTKSHSSGDVFAEKTVI